MKHEHANEHKRMAFWGLEIQRRHSGYSFVTISTNGPVEHGVAIVACVEVRWEIGLHFSQFRYRIESAIQSVWWELVNNKPPILDVLDTLFNCILSLKRFNSFQCSLTTQWLIISDRPTDRNVSTKTTRYNPIYKKSSDRKTKR